MGKHKGKEVLPMDILHKFEKHTSGSAYEKCNAGRRHFGKMMLTGAIGGNFLSAHADRAFSQT